MIRTILRGILRRVKKIKNVVLRVPEMVDGELSRLLYHWNQRQQEPPAINSKANPLFYQRQFVAHGRYQLNEPNNSFQLYNKLLKQGFRIIECDVMFTKDLVPVLCHDNNIRFFAEDKSGNPIDCCISKMTFRELTKYNFATDGMSFVTITKFEDVIKLAKSFEACVEIDLEKLYLGRKKYRILYDIVKQHNMIPNVIWEVLPQDFYSILLLDNKVILQLNHTWSENAIKKFKKNQKDCSLIILSEWFPGYVQNEFKDIIKLGHQNGFIMKCATLNSLDEAQKMFSIGVNLITTDTLRNEQVVN